MHEKDLQLKYTETSRTKQAESFYGSILSSNGIPVNLTVINPERRLMGKVCNEMPPFHSPLLLLIQVFSCILPNHVTTRTALCSDVFNCHFAWKNVEELRRRVWVGNRLNSFVMVHPTLTLGICLGGEHTVIQCSRQFYCSIYCNVLSLMVNQQAQRHFFLLVAESKSPSLTNWLFGQTPSSVIFPSTHWSRILPMISS